MANILIIEDEELIRDNLCLMLAESGYDVVTAGTGMTGVQKICERAPDLILCDIMLPGLDGYQVLKILRQSKTLFAIPFIFLTALADRDKWRKGMELGADDYITKPFTQNELLQAIEARLSKQAFLLS